MKKNELKILVKPKKVDIDFLISKMDELGFYNGVLQPHDKDRIRNGIKNRKVFVLYKDGNPIGLSTWSGEMQWAIVDYKWILPEFRGKGLGKQFAQLIYEWFLKKHIYLVMAHPATPNGEAMATTFGYKPMADTDYRFSCQDLYIFLKEGRKNLNQPSNSGFELLIWSDHNARKNPHFCYAIDNDMKENPIISIINDDAQVELRKDGKEIRKDKCKYFFTDDENQAYILYFDTNLSELLKRLGYKDNVD